MPGRLLLPPGSGDAAPLILLEHGANGSKEAPYMLQLAGRWVRDGAAVASVDLPLHGERRNAKLSHLLRSGLGLQGRPTPAGRGVLRDFVRQSVVDLRRTLDVACQLPGIDPKRVAYAGLSLGAIVGATFCGVDSRPVAVALALGGGGFGDAEDPVAHVGRISPRPLLLVNMRHDETVPASAAEALFAAAAEPKEIHWFDGGHGDLPGRGAKLMWLFLRRHLGI